MFYSNEDVANLINEIYADSQDKDSLPTLERVIKKLDDREGFALKYHIQNLKHLPIEINGKTEMFPHFNIDVKLLCLFPFGANLWTDDRSVRILKDCGTDINQDNLTKLMNERFDMFYFEHIAEGKTKDELFISFVRNLNIK